MRTFEIDRVFDHSVHRGLMLRVKEDQISMLTRCHVYVYPIRPS